MNIVSFKKKKKNEKDDFWKDNNRINILKKTNVRKKKKPKIESNPNRFILNLDELSRTCVRFEVAYWWLLSYKA